MSEFVPYVSKLYFKYFFILLIFFYFSEKLEYEYKGSIRSNVILEILIKTRMITYIKAENDMKGNAFFVKSYQITF